MNLKNFLEHSKQKVLKRKERELEEWQSKISPEYRRIRKEADSWLNAIKQKLRSQKPTEQQPMLTLNGIFFR